jgi:hypothetical protein
MPRRMPIYIDGMVAGHTEVRVTHGKPWHWKPDKVNPVEHPDLHWTPAKINQVEPVKQGDSPGVSLGTPHTGRASWYKPGEGWQGGGPRTSTEAPYSNEPWHGAINQSLRSEFGGVRAKSGAGHALVELPDGRSIVMSIDDIMGASMNKSGRVIDFNKSTMEHLGQINAGVLNGVRVTPINNYHGALGPLTPAQAATLRGGGKAGLFDAHPAPAPAETGPPLPRPDPRYVEEGILDGPQDRVNYIQSIADRAAKKLGVRPGVIEAVPDTYKFKAGGKEMEAAASALGGHVKVYTPSAMNNPEQNLPGILAHEVEHLKFEQYVKQHARSADLVPAITLEERNKLQEAGGVSDYSKAWWKDVPRGPVFRGTPGAASPRFLESAIGPGAGRELPQMRAINESLAEVARMKYEEKARAEVMARLPKGKGGAELYREITTRPGDLPRPALAYEKLYQDVEAAWQKSQKERK